MTLLPTPPTAQELIRFFASRHPLPLNEAARLIGWMERQLLLDLRREGARLPNGHVSWEDVAARLMVAWSRDWLLRSLGEHAALVPQGLHLVRTPWLLPQYVVFAMEMQASLRNSTNREVHTTDVGQYVGDLLHLAIEPETATALQSHAGFQEAFHFPYGTDRD